MRLLMSVWIIIILSASSAFAAAPYTNITINGLDNKPFFHINIANSGSESTYNGVADTSDFTLNEAEIGALRKGMEYWVTVLDKHSNPANIPEISLYTTDVNSDNASAISMDSDFSTGMTELGDMVTGQGTYNSSVALINIQHAIYFEGNWYTGDMASLPINGEMSDLPGTMLHEMAHALGLGSSTGLNDSSEYVFNNVLNLYTQGLRNIKGNAPVAGQNATEFLAKAPNDTTAGLYFTGTNVVKVLNGANLGYADGINSSVSMLGIPINTWEGDEADFSHSELQNSLMSHQDYRNWNILMEAELAIMQDIGYDIDRRNFYGYSVYGSGGTETNTNPYFARNEAGTDFVKGEYNATPWGMGLHIYGSNNNITQAADILSSGTWGIGIRVDGIKNKLIINPNTKVHANGVGGNALAVTYGNGHDIVHRGDLTAEGSGGAAASFDFGSNEMGNLTEYRGSWLRIKWDAKDNKYVKYAGSILSALKGSLVESFDVTGSLIGSYAAIYIANNAHVANINIMNGAYILGDIVSDWNPSWDLIDITSDITIGREDLLTKLSFGIQANGDGEASIGTADPNFSLHYNDNIYGQESIRMFVDGGRLTFNGEAKLLTAHVKINAILAGTGRYEVGLSDKKYTGVDKEFVNAGTLLTYNPSNLLDMSGVYIKSNDFVSTTGKLGVLVNAAGAVGGLTLDGAAANQNETFASLSIAPAQDYYDSNVTINVASAVKNAGTVTYTDKVLTLLPAFTSPTLSFSVSGNTNTSAQLIVTRPDDAYEQYETNDASEDIATMLDEIAGTPGAASGDMENLISAIDFSDASTASEALEQLSDAAVESSEQITMQSQHATSGAFVNHMLTPVDMQTSSTSGGFTPVSGLAGNENNNDANVWRAFSSVVGITSKQNNTSSMTGYSTSGIGLIGGLERDFDTGLTAGVNLSIQHREFNSFNADNAKIKTDGIAIGVHGLFKPVDWSGAYIMGQLRGGLEGNNMERTIDFNNYKRTNSSNWTDYVVSSTLGGGWDMEYNNILLGPVAWLDYSALIRPAFQEYGGGASSLSYDATTLHSLRSSLGGRFSAQHKFEESQTVLQGNLLLAWQHALLNSQGTTRSAFVGYEEFGVTHDNPVQYRDSLLVQAGVKAMFNDSTSLNFQLGSEFFYEGYSSLMASLSLTWEF